MKPAAVGTTRKQECLLGKAPGAAHYRTMRALHYLRDALVFSVCYVALDWASYIHPLGPFNITPWSPQPALAIVWMLLAGLRQLPAVFATIFVAEALVRGSPAGYSISLMTAATLGLGYAAIAALLRREFTRGPGLHSTRRLTVFAGTVVAGAAVVGAAFVGLLWNFRLLRDIPPAQAVVQFWVGDAVGILVTAPLLLAATDPAHRRGIAEYLRHRDTPLQLAALVGTIAAIFVGFGGDPATHFYLLFMPLIWIALRGGINGVILATAVVQMGIVVFIHRSAAADLPVLELQAFLIALTLTSLYLGVVVDERQRAAEELRESLRLAAAGEMAGALAHELNQPLSALTNYGRAAQIVLDRRGGALEELPGILQRMVAEGQRAADILRRLRDFFRAGTLHLEEVAVEELVASAHRMAREMIGDRPIAADAKVAEALPLLKADRLQIELVLRNLIANAIEAVSDAASPAGVAIEAFRDGERHVAIAVHDTGPGPPAALRARLFQPFATGKPTGLGLGLAVSRAIAEAHGGTLEARHDGRSEFRLLLPCSESA